MIILNLINPNFRVLLLSLKLKLEIKQKNLRVLKELLLLLETSIRERFLESNTFNKERIRDRSTLDKLHTHKVFIEKVGVKDFNSLDNELAEVLFLRSQQLRV